MIPQIQAALNTILGHAAILRNAGGAGRAFELFVMTGIANELVARGYDVWLQRSDGTRVGPGDRDRRFIQRGGAPTGLAGAMQGAGNASVICFQFGSRSPWEIWNGIQFSGRSGALHELDLAILPAEVGNALRALPTGGTPTGRPRIAVECKDVGTTGSPDEMRAFIARLYDLTLLESHHPYLALSWSAKAIHPTTSMAPYNDAARSYWVENRRTFNCIARRTGFSVGAAAMTGYHSVAPHGGITVGSPTTAVLINDIADWIYSEGY